MEQKAKFLGQFESRVTPESFLQPTNPSFPGGGGPHTWGRDPGLACERHPNARTGFVAVQSTAPNCFFSHT